MFCHFFFARPPARPGTDVLFHHQHIHPISVFFFDLGNQFNIRDIILLQLRCIFLLPDLPQSTTPMPQQFEISFGRGIQPLRPRPFFSAQVHVLSLSSGNADGLGPGRVSSFLWLVFSLTLSQVGGWPCCLENFFEGIFSRSRFFADLGAVNLGFIPPSFKTFAQNTRCLKL